MNMILKRIEQKRVENFRKEMQRTIDIAWSTTDPDIRKRQQELFPSGKPSVDEFIEVISLNVASRLEKDA